MLFRSRGPAPIDGCCRSLCTMKVLVPFTWAMASVSRISDEYFNTRVTRLTLNEAKLPEVRMVDERDGSALMQADEEASRATRANLAQKVSALERDRREEEERERHEEEERERRMDYVPEQSEVNTELIQVDPDTRDMLRELDMSGLPNITTTSIPLGRGRR